MCEAKTIWKLKLIDTFLHVLITKFLQEYEKIKYPSKVTRKFDFHKLKQFERRKHKKKTADDM